MSQDLRVKRQIDRLSDCMVMTYYITVPPTITVTDDEIDYYCTEIIHPATSKRNRCGSNDYYLRVANVSRGKWEYIVVVPKVEGEYKTVCDMPPVMTEIRKQMAAIAMDRKMDRAMMHRVNREL